jgi:hypothetical protein
VSSRDHGLRKVELLIELERAGLDCKRARGCAGFRRLVDDANPYALPGQPKRKNEPGWARANDQNLDRHSGASLCGARFDDNVVRC